MTKTQALRVLLLVAIVGLVAADRLYLSAFKERFKKFENARILTSNKLATAKIVHTNLNHVRDLVFKNIVFQGRNDTAATESQFFDFITTCMNDLKLRLISVKPTRPVTQGRITTYGYDIELEGDFFSFGELCAKFENSRRIVSLGSFEVSQEAQQSTNDGAGARLGKNVRVKMSISTYRIAR